MPLILLSLRDHDFVKAIRSMNCCPWDGNDRRSQRVDSLQMLSVGFLNGLPQTLGVDGDGEGMVASSEDHTL